jgi:cellulose synthase/poly-beta-1,6-N-acetylglucosamine synthase-like glycosyltransferase
VNTEPSDRQGFEAGSPEIGDPDVRMISVVVALFNEQDNVDALLTEIHDAMEASPWPWELILVDDGSTDRTLELLRAGRARHGEHVTVLELRRNFGQTAATQAGLDAAWPIGSFGRNWTCWPDGGRTGRTGSSSARSRRFWRTGSSDR